MSAVNWITNWLYCWSTVVLTNVG